MPRILIQIWLVVGLTVGTMAYGQTVTEVCQSVIRLRDHSNLGPRFTLKDALRLTLSPKSAMGVSQFQVDGKLVDLDRAPLEVKSFDQLTVFTLSQILPLSTESDEEILGQYQEYSRKNRRQLNALGRAKSLDECLEIARRNGFTQFEVDQFESAAQRFYLRREELLSSQMADWLRANTRASVIAPEDYELGLDSYEASVKKSDRPQHLFFTFHGDSPDGALSSRNGLTVDSRFFERLDQIQELRSLVFFSCYPERTARYYKDPLIQLARRGVRVFFPRNTGPLEKFPITLMNLFPFFFDQVYAGIRSSAPQVSKF